MFFWFHAAVGKPGFRGIFTFLVSFSLSLEEGMCNLISYHCLANIEPRPLAQPETRCGICLY